MLQRYSIKGLILKYTHSSLNTIYLKTHKNYITLNKYGKLSFFRDKNMTILHREDGPALKLKYNSFYYINNVFLGCEERNINKGFSNLNFMGIKHFKKYMRLSLFK